MKQQGLPRWRGFNLEAGISLEREYHEQDFQMIADLGFDFVRLPVRYDRWSKITLLKFSRLHWSFWTPVYDTQKNITCMFA